MALVMRIAYSCTRCLLLSLHVDTLHFLGLASSHKSSALKSKSKSLTFFGVKSFGVKSKSQKTGLESYSSPSHKSKYYTSLLIGLVVAHKVHNPVNNTILLLWANSSKTCNII
jgi:hypothetical protein